MTHVSVSIQALIQLFIVVLSVITIAQSQSCDTTCQGFASIEGGTTGGGSSAVVVVRTINELRNACSGVTASVIRVSGTIRTGPTPVLIGSNKSVIGQSGAVIFGALEVSAGSSNVIIRSLVVIGTGFNNAVIVRGARKVWIDHCDFSDSTKDLVYIDPDADLCTVSWNKFKYSQAIADRYACVIGDANVASSRVRVTVYNNHFSDNIVQGMTAVYGGQTHFVNNYSDYIGAKSGIGVDAKAAVLVEANSLLDVNVVLVVSLNLVNLVSGVVTTVGNVVGGILGTNNRNGSFNSPPYTLKVAAAADVAAVVNVCANVNVSILV